MSGRSLLAIVLTRNAAAAQREKQSFSLVGGRLAVILLMLLMALSGCTDKPRESDLERSVKSLLPTPWVLSYFAIEASQNVGDTVDPLWKYRFNARAVLSEDTYMQSGQKAEFVLIKKTGNIGGKIDLHGYAHARLRDGRWNIGVNFDNNPMERFGAPRGTFKGQTVILNTVEEDDLNAELEKRTKIAENARRQEISRKNSIIEAALMSGKRLLGLKSPPPWMGGMYVIYSIDVKSFDRNTGEVTGTIDYKARIPGTGNRGPVHAFNGLLRDGLLSLSEMEETRKGGYINEVTRRFTSESIKLRDYHIAIGKSDQLWDANWSDKGENFWGWVHNVQVE